MIGAALRRSCPSPHADVSARQDSVSTGRYTLLAGSPRAPGCAIAGAQPRDGVSVAPRSPQKPYHLHSKLSLAVALALAVTSLVAGCGPSTGAPASRSTGGVAAAIPTIPVATRASVPFPRAALLAKLDNESQMLLLSPVDPTTGTALAADAPIRLGVNFYYRFTPDRKSLIFASYLSTDPSRATLHIVDLASWHDESAIQITSKGWPSALTVSRDGALFAIVIVQPKDSSLWLVDAVKHVVLAHHVMPLLVTSMQFTGDHQGLMLYGRQEDPNTSLSGGPPIAQLLSARGLDMLWSRTLKDVRDGFEPNQTFTGSAHDPGAGTTFRPAVVFAPDTDVMYIVHAGEDKLTRVDFAKKSALTLDVRPAASWFEQLLAFTRAPRMPRRRTASSGARSFRRTARRSTPAASRTSGARVLPVRGNSRRHH